MTDKSIEELQDRVWKFMSLELPGQPQMMHMGTSYLVQDLMAKVKELAEKLHNQETLK